MIQLAVHICSSIRRRTPSQIKKNFVYHFPLQKVNPEVFGIDGPIISYSEPDQSSIHCQDTKDLYERQLPPEVAVSDLGEIDSGDVYKQAWITIFVHPRP